MLNKYLIIYKYDNLTAYEKNFSFSQKVSIFDKACHEQKLILLVPFEN